MQIKVGYISADNRNRNLGLVLNNQLPPEANAPIVHNLSYSTFLLSFNFFPRNNIVWPFLISTKTSSMTRISICNDKTAFCILVSKLIKIDDIIISKKDTLI